MPANYLIPPGGDAPSKLPNVDREQDYFGRLYLIANPPADFRRRHEFVLPSGVHADLNRRIVVAFMLDPTDRANMRYEVRLNETLVAQGHPVGGTKRGIWEVAGGEQLRDAPTTNALEFWVLPDGDSRGFLNFSDVTIWYTST